MKTSTHQICPNCGYENDPEAASCGLCGELIDRDSIGRLQSESEESSSGMQGLVMPGPEMRRESSVPPDASEMTFPQPGAALGAAGGGSPLTPWLFLATGLVLSQAFQLTQITSFMAWFLSALPHEMGHSLFACYVGMPAYPAISLAGHAAAFHQPQSLALALLIWTALAGFTYAMRKHAIARSLLGFAVVTYPLLAFFETPRELMHLLGGHLGELAFATVCFWRALSGGFSKSQAERLLYAVLAWHLLIQNLWMCWRLMTNANARATYRGNGSFGLTNDYIRVAEDVLAWSLPSVAALMFVVSLGVLPLSFLIWRLRPE